MPHPTPSFQPAATDRTCKYVYKTCSNLRTFKRDGSLHRLCEYHRAKANALQKVYATKRRCELRAAKRHHAMKTKIAVSAAVHPPVAQVPRDLSMPSHPSTVTLASSATVPLSQHLELAFLMDLEPLDAAVTDVDSLSDEEYAYLQAVL
ncbi:hypothetical protein H310_14360 [Aphanomyces invadans]|uniref:Uncharacterized protein n=1 Tax=Aphanomyces invadans TaxID=157072 RepID=A0A024TBI4_9STRA|nr:hypothetical protein H310_14360 [Aphanomyces invadans]ETV90946.1 hypothetical protein H310_14360 [Aphanomyces invadans]|eukprot:XP_008880428.1 hypothetical protein H310_14360 [Aphanomyces invadans]